MGETTHSWLEPHHTYLFMSKHLSRSNIFPTALPPLCLLKWILMVNSSPQSQKHHSYSSV